MGKKRNRDRTRAARGGTARRAAGAAPPPPPWDRGAAAAAVVLGLVLAGTALAVDTRAAAAFDAPKRLIAVVGTALAAAAALFGPLSAGRAAAVWRNAPRLPRLALVFAAAALTLAALAAVVSPRRPLALDAMRVIAVLALLLPIGASRVFPRAGAALAAVFLGAAAVNAIVSVLEARGVYSPFQLETFGARQETGAYAGNVGYLAIALALAATVALGVVLTAGRPRIRVLAAAALVLFAAGLIVNRNLTALTAALAGIAVLLILRFRRRAALPLAAAAALVVIAVVAYAPLRQRAHDLGSEAAAGRWDAVVSFRGGPWASSFEMIRERPLLGFGPGTFGAEYVPHRLAAEIRARRRFDSPLRTSSYSETHNDYLQVASDAGLPAAVLAVAAAACLLAAAFRAAWKRGDGEAMVLAAMLAAGFAAALAWFPLQRPITAVPLLLAAGRAWAVAGEPDAEAELEA